MNDATTNDARDLSSSGSAAPALSKGGTGSASAHTLPLTEPGGTSAAPNDAISESEIRVLVDSFYDAVRQDDLLGPVFAQHVQDWSLHLPKMYDFWSTVVRRTGRYAGRPFEAHQAIPGLTSAHFDRWLALWEATVSRVFAFPRAHAREAFVVAARRMAASMSARLLEA